MKYFDRNSEQSKIDFLLENITKYDDMSLSTSDTEGNPRALCVNFDIDKNFNIFWKSASNSFHSKNLKSNAHASILIYRAYEDYDFAMYSKGKVSVVEDREILEKLLKIKYDNKGRIGKTIDQFQGESTNRIYLYKIEELHVADKSHKKSEINIGLLAKQWLKNF